jgi:hypothetical protein
MQAQLEMIAGIHKEVGCNFSQSSFSGTWFVNLRITDTKEYPFINCNNCSRQRCYRFKSGKSVLPIN